MCSPGWTGQACGQLDLLPAPVPSRNGYNVPNTSSWGAGVLFDESTQLYHMWAAEFINHCGLLTWHNNSRVIHATATVSSGPYSFVDEAVPVYSHNPSVGKVAPHTSGVRPESIACVLQGNLKKHHELLTPAQLGQQTGSALSSCTSALASGMASRHSASMGALNPETSRQPRPAQPLQAQRRQRPMEPSARLPWARHWSRATGRARLASQTRRCGWRVTGRS